MIIPNPQSTEVEHTPGPWRAMIGESDPLLIVGLQDGFPIAEVGTTLWPQ